MWAAYEADLPREAHQHVYPHCAGEGVASSLITINNTAGDETGTDESQYYWGEPVVLMPVEEKTLEYRLYGWNIAAGTPADITQTDIYKVIYNTEVSRSAGNDWDEGATVLTVNDGSKFAANDLVWIYSDYKTNGEILKVASKDGNEITIERETVESARTGLRWDHTTNDPGTEKMYRIYRSTDWGSHPIEFNYSAGTTRDFNTTYLHKPKELRSNDGLIARMVNLTDNAPTEFDISLIWRD